MARKQLSTKHSFDKSPRLKAYYNKLKSLKANREYEYSFIIVNNDYDAICFYFKNGEDYQIYETIEGKFVAYCVESEYTDEDRKVFNTPEEAYKQILDWVGTHYKNTKREEEQNDEMDELTKSIFDKFISPSTEKIAVLKFALNTIANFPVTDPKNQDAINLQNIAKLVLREFNQ